MHAGDHYTFREFLRWTQRDSYVLLAVALVPTALYAGLGWRWLAVPWVPIALIGTAAAFIVGFRNNATYDRAWEARQVYGAIVNASRTWAVYARDFVRAGAPSGTLSDAEAAAVRARLVHRHLAWLTALRYQLRQPRAWESMRRPHNVAYQRGRYAVAEWTGDLGADLAALVGPGEAARVLRAANRATQLVALQSAEIADLAARGALEPNRHVALARVLADLYEQQGRCERIKNFPYPRQFASINLFFVRLFVGLVPLGLLGEFQKLGDGAVWLTVPFSAVVGWVFTGLERVGQSTENPFEGSANDVPITALSRTIEIDLREILGETDVPAPLAPERDILM